MNIKEALNLPFSLEDKGTLKYPCVLVKSFG